VIHTRNFSADAAGLDPGQFFEIGDDRSHRVAVERVAVQCLGVQHELAAVATGAGRKGVGLGRRRRDRHLATKLKGTHLKRGSISLPKTKTVALSVLPPAVMPPAAIPSAYAVTSACAPAEYQRARGTTWRAYCRGW
jgi:hypothetical protein